MGFYLTGCECERREKTHPPSKNRVWDFFATSHTCAGQNVTFAQYPRPENEPTATATVSGVRYYGFRFYAPTLGRWLNRDPIGEEGGINLYQAMFNDLLSFIDPLGLDPCCPGGKPIDCAQLSSRINRTRNSIRGAIDQLGEIGGFFEKAEMYNRVSLGITAVQAVVGVGATAYSSLTRNLSVAATQSSRGMLSVGLHTQSGRIALAGEPGFKVAASAAMQIHNMATLSIAAKEMGPTIGTVSGSSFGNLAKRILDPFGRLSDVLTDDGARLSSEISETIKMLQELFASQLELYNECCR